MGRLPQTVMNIRNAIDKWRQVKPYGAAYLARRAREKLTECCLHLYDRRWRAARPGESELARQRANQPEAGLISIAVPVYNTDPRMLEEMLESFLSQTYANWEACLYDASINEDTREVLRKYSERDPRIRVTFSERNDGISGNTNHAFAMARGAWTALCDHDDLYTPDALWRLAERIAADAPDVLYTDEDRITENSAYVTEPHYKPDFCPDNLRSSNYICHLVCVRTALLRKIGGERGSFDGSQDHDLVLRCMEETDRFCHIPEVCYHWRIVRSSESHQHLDRCLQAACAATAEHMARIGFPGEAVMERSVERLRYALPAERTVAVILLRHPDGDEAGLRESLSEYGWADSVTAISPEPGALAEAAQGIQAEFTLVLDTRLKLTDRSFADELLMYAQRPDVGAVTPVIADRRKRIIHAGYAVDGDGGCHGRNRGMRCGAGGTYLMAFKSHNVTAVSALCLMARTEALRSLEADWQGIGAAVEGWCLAMQQRGFRHVFTPHARAVMTAPDQDIPPCAADQRRLKTLLPEGWHDPCWNRHLDIQKTDFSENRG